jgi:hypothetical protein
MKTPHIPRLSRQKTSGQAVVCLDGHDHNLGRIGTPEARNAYEELVGRWLANGRRLPEAKPDGATVNEIVLAFVRHAERHYANGEKSSCGGVASIKQACKVMRSLYGRTPAVEFGPKALKLVRVAMVDRGWSRGSANAQVNRTASSSA